MRKLIALCSAVCLMASLCIPASALEYTINTPDGPEYANATSVEPVMTADQGERSNTDLSKSNPVVAPAFGSNTSYLPGSGEPLYPFLGIAGDGPQAVSIPTVLQPHAPGTIFSLTPSNGIGNIVVEPSSPSYGFTEVTGDMYYSGNYLGRVKIPSLGVNVKVYEGTDSSALSNGAGHFEDTSIWEGNVCVAGHNRGANCYFGEIHTLSLGDKIILTTKLGNRIYQVTSVSKISELDNSLLAPSTDNRITLFTCVRGQSAYRWAVQAVEAS